jgi:voltage-gated potassium channel
MGQRATVLERRLELPMLIAAALVVPALILEQSKNRTYHSIAHVLDWAIWLAFLGELVTMLSVVRSRAGWLRHNPLSVAIVVLTPPFVPALLQSLRLLRLLRLGPIYKKAFSLQGVRYATVFAVLVVVTTALGFESAEPGVSFFNAVYWALGTLSSVGSGNVVATTEEAKLMAMLLMVVGIGYFAVITGSIAERFVSYGEESRVEEAVEESAGDDLPAQIERIALRVRELGDEVEALHLAVTKRRL